MWESRLWKRKRALLIWRFTTAALPVIPLILSSFKIKWKFWYFNFETRSLSTGLNLLSFVFVSVSYIVSSKSASTYTCFSRKLYFQNNWFYIYFQGRLFLKLGKQWWFITQVIIEHNLSLLYLVLAL